MKSYLFIILFCLISSKGLARSIVAGPGVVKAPSDYANVILGSMWEDAGWPENIPHNVEPDPEPKPAPAPAPAPIVVPKKKIKPLPKKVVKNDEEEDSVVEPDDEELDDEDDHEDQIAPKKKVTKKKELSKGQKYIQEMLKKNRAKLNQKREEEKAKDHQAKVDQLDNSNKSLREQYLNNLSKLKKRNQATFSHWKKTRDATYKRWKEKQKQFFKNLPHYKKAQFVFEAPVVSIPKRELKKAVSKVPSDKYHIIPGALEAPIKDQGRRPTCAAFAGIRAIEVLLRSADIEKDLSEQYFYWASKPACQNRPCSQRGSWVLKGFDESRKAFSPNIPMERSCPYKKQQISSNETQVPLSSQCKKGAVKVGGFSRLSSLDDIISALSANQPVVAGFKLSPNFYKNDGFISYGDSFVNGKMDSHAMGHAVLLVGYMKLPKKLHGREGRVCLIVANSWGEGWGRGGHACVSERWVRQYRIENAFVAVNKADII